MVRPGTCAAVLGTALRCLRRLVPGAILLVTPALAPVGLEVIALDADEVVAGPLSAATALVRARHAARAAGGEGAAARPRSPVAGDARSPDHSTPGRVT